MTGLDMDYIREQAARIEQNEKARESQQGDEGSLFMDVVYGLMEFHLLPSKPEGKSRMGFEDYSHFEVPPGDMWSRCPRYSWPHLKLTCDICSVLDEFREKKPMQRQEPTNRPRINVYIPDGEINKSNKDVLPHIGKIRILRVSGGAWSKLFKEVSTCVRTGMGDPADPYNSVVFLIEKHNRKKAQGKKKLEEWQKIGYELRMLPMRRPLTTDKAQLQAMIARIPDLEKIFPTLDDGQRAELKEKGQKFRSYMLSMTSQQTMGNPQAPATQIPPVSSPAASAASLPASAPTPQVAPPASPPPSSPAPSSGQKPNCFSNDKEGVDDGQGSKLHAYNPSSPKCLACFWEVPCMKEIENRKKAAKSA